MDAPLRMPRPKLERGKGKTLMSMRQQVKTQKLPPIVSPKPAYKGRKDKLKANGG